MKKMLVTLSLVLAITIGALGATSALAAENIIVMRIELQKDIVEGWNDEELCHFNHFLFYHFRMFINGRAARAYSYKEEKGGREGGAVIIKIGFVPDDWDNGYYYPPK